MLNEISAIANLLRIDRPVGTMLLYWPCAWGVLLLSPGMMQFKLLLNFLFGSFIMRSAGCIINDLWDQNIDRQVERTKTRPLASREISNFKAIKILLVLLLSGLIILSLFKMKAIVAAFSVMPLVIIYPLMKRFTYFPQLVLGAIFNFGIIIASLQLADCITFPSALLYLGGICWTLSYDTIYGFMDKEDDKKVGVRSLALWLENKRYTLWLTVFNALFIILILSSKVITSVRWLSKDLLVVTVLVAQIYWQLQTLNIHRVQNCLQRFKGNNMIGFLVALLLIH